MNCRVEVNMENYLSIEFISKIQLDIPVLRSFPIIF